MPAVIADHVVVVLEAQNAEAKAKVKEYRASVEGDMAAVTAAAGKAEKSLAGIGSASKFTRFELTNLAYQLNDVVTGFISGQRPFQVFAQQGGQIAQILANRPGGITGGLKALSGLLSPTVVRIGAMAVGFGSLALGMGLAAKSAFDFAAAQDRAGAALYGAGRAAGATVPELEQIAETSARAGNVTVQGARDMEAALLRTGRVSKDQIGQVIGIMDDFAAAAGLKGPQALQVLSNALAHPAEGARTLSELVNALTGDELRNIDALVAQGRQMEAAQIIIDAVSRSTQGAADKTDALSRFFRGLKVDVSQATTALGGYLNRLAQLAGFGPKPETADQALQRGFRTIDANRARESADIHDVIKGLEPSTTRIGELKGIISRIQKDVANNIVSAADGAKAIAAANHQIAQLKRSGEFAPGPKGPKGPKDRTAEALDQATSDELSAHIQLLQEVQRQSDIFGDQSALAAQILDLQKQQVDAETKKKNDAVNSADNIKPAEKEKIIAANNTAAEEKKLALTKRSEAEVAQRNLLADQFYADLQNRTLQAQADIYQAQAGLALTAKERLEFEQKALAARQEAERRALADRYDALQKANPNTDYSSARRNEERTLADQQAVQRDVLAQANLTPIQQYQRELVDTSTIIEQDAVSAIRGLGDEAGQSAARVLGLKGALGQFVGQLISLFLQQQFGGSAAGTLAGLGKSLFGFSGFHAAGGFIPPGQWGIVGEKGPEPAFGGRTGLSIQPNSSLAMGGPGGIAGLRIWVNPSPMLDVHIEQVAAPVAQRYANAAGQSARATARTDADRRKRFGYR